MFPSLPLGATALNFRLSSHGKSILLSNRNFYELRTGRVLTPLNEP